MTHPYGWIFAYIFCRLAINGPADSADKRPRRNYRVSKKKSKFDLTHLVHSGYLKDGQTLYYVSDPSKTCVVTKQPNGEYKVKAGNETTTVHAFAQKCLGMDPPDHASKWLRTENSKTLYDYWHQDDYAEAA